ncbi:GNAT family N-acetyltransferase [Streptomyces avermitilis]|uniref:GNAT family N-acetyltransferase n=1 Tax=Streptomyces avermitilis TaxID=33903 RepID=UPI0036BE356E
MAEEGLWAEGATRTTVREVESLTRSAEIVTARMDGDVVGCVRVQQLDERVSEFGMLAASLERRGLGIGRELVRFAERDGRQKGFETMQLELLVPRDWSHPSKVILDEWYTCIGYEVTGTGSIEDFYPELAPHLATACDFVIGLGSDTKDRAKVVFAGPHSVQRFSKLASNGPFGHLAQTPKVIGPLAPQSAAELLVEPMRALGFEFKDLDLVNRVLGYCSYQPFLLQMLGHRLVELLHRKWTRRGAEGPPYEVEVTDIEVVESDAALRDGISAAFKDTLSLDHRYDVIANVLAYHARHNGLEVRLSDIEVREECETCWRKGFEQLDTEGFRAYLSEMVGPASLRPITMAWAGICAAPTPCAWYLPRGGGPPAQGRTGL